MNVIIPLGIITAGTIIILGQRSTGRSIREVIIHLHILQLIILLIIERAQFVGMGGGVPLLEEELVLIMVV